MQQITNSMLHMYSYTYVSVYCVSFTVHLWIYSTVHPEVTLFCMHTWQHTNALMCTSTTESQRINISWLVLHTSYNTVHYMLLNSTMGMCACTPGDLARRESETSGKRWKGKEKYTVSPICFSAEIKTQKQVNHNCRNNVFYMTTNECLANWLNSEKIASLHQKKSTSIKSILFNW